MELNIAEIWKINTYIAKYYDINELMTIARWSITETLLSEKTHLINIDHCKDVIS